MINCAARSSTCRTNRASVVCGLVRWRRLRRLLRRFLLPQVLDDAVHPLAAAAPPKFPKACWSYLLRFGVFALNHIHLLPKQPRTCHVHTM